jgi:hypothetical protein
VNTKDNTSSCRGRLAALLDGYIERHVRYSRMRSGLYARRVVTHDYRVQEVNTAPTTEGHDDEANTTTG